jgi:hypothetical protein
VLLSLAVLGGCGPGEAGEGESLADHLEYRIEADKAQYSLGETVLVRGYLRNSTDEDLRISAWPSTEEMALTHRNGDKSATRKDAAKFQEPDDAGGFITVEAQSEILFGSEEFGQEYFDKLGEWELQTRLVFDWTGAEHGLSACVGQMDSNALSVIIVPSE